jgi:Protein of unknown function (DUF4231)
MAKKNDYTDFLKEDFGKLFDTMELSDLQRHFLRSRWLDQVLWMEKKAGHCRDRHYQLRLTAIVFGVIVPILVGLDIGSESANKVKQYVAITLSGMVAISAAVEEFFHYGERWNNYRRTVESLKTQGWKFSQLSPPYSNFVSHAEAFPTFADQVEQLIQKDVETYVTEITRPESSENKPLDDLLRRDLEDYLAQRSSPPAAPRSAPRPSTAEPPASLPAEDPPPESAA